MCGIAGIVNKDGGPVKEAEISSVTRASSHRGPDGEGFYFGDGFAFGHRRLSIQDLTEAGHQPMVSSNSGCVLTYNGEIYNYLELRRQLEQCGRVFTSRCDTEVLLVAYEVWGKSCVERFNGMWAFAIYDATENVIFCSRDRFGVKPFYYYESAGRFAFASELKQLVSLLPTRSANREVVLDFILTKITDTGANTFFENLYRLPPGHNLIYKLRDGNKSISPYYQLRRDPSLSKLSAEEAVVQYRRLLQSSIELRLRADVKVGTCLSGGLDSSSVGVLAAQLYHAKGTGNFSAITAVSTHKINDESRFARAVAEHSGMNWIPVQPSYQDFLNVLPEVAYFQEEPYGGPSVIMQYFVMRTAQENGITVLLDGQGGDETLLGYEKYYVAFLVDLLRREGGWGALKGVQDILRNNANMSMGRLVKYLVAGLSAQSRYRFYRLQHKYLREFPSIPWHLEAFSDACLDVFRLQVLENTSTNLPVLLRYEDKNSMRYSVEARLPFLDYRLVEMALSIPSSLKIYKGWTKWLLRKGLSEELPEEIRWRRDKKGFEAPEAQWLPKHTDQMKAAVLQSPLLAALSYSNHLATGYERLDPRSRWRLYSVAMWEKAYSVVI